MTHKLLVKKEIQMKMTLRFILTPVRVAVIKKTNSLNVVDVFTV
jgi:hypothetical protein